MDVQRKVCSKRNRRKSGRTPLKSKQPRTSDARASSSGTWIDNSFDKNELQLKDSSMRLTPRRSQRQIEQENGARSANKYTRSRKSSSRPGDEPSRQTALTNGRANPTPLHQNPNGTESEEEHDTFNDSDSLFPEQDLELPPMQHPDPGIKATSRAPSLQGSHCSAELFPSNTTATSGTTPQNVKTLTQVLLEHQYFPSDPNQPDPPVNTSRALKERFNHTLLQNAKATTPYRARQEELREEARRDALRAAEEAAAGAADLRDLGPFYGLPSRVQQLLQEHKGISQLYDWQHECLTLGAVNRRQNLVYSLPTSGGKTLVAEILILKELLCRQKDAMLILPYVSIVQEKVRGLSGFALDLEFFVEEYAAHKGQIPPRNRRKRKSLYICTIEKANSLINSLIETKRIENIGLCVVDELHMLGEGGSRGAILEMSLAKLVHMNSDVQIVGMSATLSNIDDLASFLNAHVYTNDFRPVKLTEYVKIEDVIYRVNSRALVPEERLVLDRHVSYRYKPEDRRLDPDHLLALVGDVVPQNSCLVFCPTKKNCENVSNLLCKLLPRTLLDHKKSEKKALLKVLWHEGGGEICPTLRKTIPFGVAYHHGGLTMDERKLIEEAYSENILCLLCCTSTLAAGVNLPAKRVILRSPYVGVDFLSRSQYKQMTGRAGRAGLDTSGESFLIVQKRDSKQVLDLATGPMEFCQSSLMYQGSKGMRQMLLTTVGLQITPTMESVVRFLRSTLCYVQRERLGVTDVSALAWETVAQLEALGLVTRSRPGAAAPCAAGEDDPDACAALDVSELGRGVFKGAIDCDLGPRLLRDLQEASDSLVVANHLHLLYLVTPYDLVDQARPNWMLYLDELGSLDQSEQKVASLIGVSEGYVARQISGQCTKKDVDVRAVMRFYLTLVLYNLWRQKTIWQVAVKFQLPRGVVQSLLTAATAFASCVLHFCQEIQRFWALQALFEGFVKKLSCCQVADLGPLLEVPGVKMGRARQLHKAGYRSLQHVASADPEQLVAAIQHMPRKTARQIVTAAQMVLQEKAEALLEEAQDVVSVPSDMPVPERPGAATTASSDAASSQSSLL